MFARRFLLCVLVSALCSLLSADSACAETSTRIRRDSKNVKESKPTASGQIDFNKQLRITHIATNRYRSMATLSFLLQVPSNYPMGGYDPNLRLLEGFGGGWLLSSTQKIAWKTLKWDETTVVVTLEVRNIDPRATSLENLLFELEVKKRGHGRAYQQTRFYFDTLPL